MHGHIASTISKWVVLPAYDAHLSCSLAAAAGSIILNTTSVYYTIDSANKLAQNLGGKGDFSERRAVGSAASDPLGVRETTRISVFTQSPWSSSESASGRVITTPDI